MRLFIMTVAIHGSLFADAEREALSSRLGCWVKTASFRDEGVTGGKKRKEIMDAGRLGSESV